MKKIYGDHVYSQLRNLREGELVLRLQQCFTGEEAIGIINEIHSCEEHCYTQPGFTIFYSGINDRYAIFATNEKYNILTKDFGLKYCAPPKDTRSVISNINMWDGKPLADSDVDYIMNCLLICKDNPAKAKGTVAGLVRTLIKTIIMLDKKATAKMELKEVIGEEDAAEGSKQDSLNLPFAVR